MGWTTRWTRGTRGVATALVLAVGVVGCDDDESGIVEADPTVVDLAAGSADLETLAAAVGAAELTGTLSGSGPFTVFAPTDAAFEALGAGTVSALLEPENQGILVELLTGHVVAGDVRAAELSDGQVLTTLSGDELTVSLEGPHVFIDGQMVQAADVEASNGVVHVIGGVLTAGLNVAERATITPGVSTLVTALSEAGLVGALQAEGPFTVFAPVNAAFAELDPDALARLLAEGNEALLTKVLTYHVVPGRVLSTDLVDDAQVATLEGSEIRIDLDDGATVNGVEIVATDIEVENGVIHLIDGVLLDHLDLVDVAVLNGFDDLVAAVQSAGLTEALRDESAALTVFAPTNAAFDAVTPLPTGETLQSVLLYHVVNGAAFAGDLSDGQVLTTLETGTVTVSIAGAAVSLDGAGSSADVLVADVPASNGVIHVIDTVLLPPVR